eukprot:sb/3473011/
MAYPTATVTYFSYNGWKYLNHLPEDSGYRQLLTDAEHRNQTTPFSTINRYLAFVEVMSNSAKVDDNTDLTELEVLSHEQKHEVQARLRWLPADKYRLMNRSREWARDQDWYDPLAERIRLVQKEMFMRRGIFANEAALRAHTPPALREDEGDEEQAD